MQLENSNVIAMVESEVTPSNLEKKVISNIVSEIIIDTLKYVILKV